MDWRTFIMPKIIVDEGVSTIAGWIEEENGYCAKHLKRNNLVIAITLLCFIPLDISHSRFNPTLADSFITRGTPATFFFVLFLLLNFKVTFIRNYDFVLYKILFLAAALVAFISQYEYISVFQDRERFYSPLMIPAAVYLARIGPSTSFIFFLACLAVWRTNYHVSEFSKMDVNYFLFSALFTYFFKNNISSRAQSFVYNTRLIKAEKNLREEEAKNARNALGRQYSTAIVDRIMSGDLDFDEKPSKKVLTIMFVDIVGFTKFCEAHDPTTVANAVNKIMQGFIGAIFKNRGTLDKIIGDACMAYWGSPEAIEPREQARLALKTGNEILAFLREVNESWSYDFKIRIGIHTDEVSELFIAGREQTILGDGVNIANRIESVGEENSINVSADTQALLDHNQLEFAKEIKLKGKEKSVKIYAITNKSA